MTKIDCTFMSTVLAHEVTVTVLIPNYSPFDTRCADVKFPVLYLLHGYSDCHSHWLRYTNVELYAEEKSLAVVMPSARNSFYVDMKYGMKYQTFVGKELPAKMQSLFPISADRADNFIAGNSMGGYGALLTALTNPEKFAAAISFSGAVDAAEFMFTRGDSGIDGIPAFGSLEESRGSEKDVLHLLGEHIKNGTKLPDLFSICGTEDFLYDNNIRFRDYCKQIGAKLDYHEEPGAHDWYFWDKHLRSVLGKLNIRRA